MGRTRNPFSGLVDTMSEMARMREYAEGGGTEDQRRTHATAWVPTTDIFAVGSDLVVRCELSGVEEEDVEISLSASVLTIQGERKGEPHAAEFYARERYYGRFRRSMSLPEGVSGEDVSANFENGLLEITVRGGAQQPEPERIRITSRVR